MAQGFVGTRLNPDIEEHAAIIDYIEELPHKSHFLRALLYEVAMGKINVDHIHKALELARIDIMESGGERDEN
jgi:hypothetical protein